MTPETLAVLRISVCAVALMSVKVHNSPHFGGLPAHLRVAPWGVGWLLPHLPEWLFGTGEARGAWVVCVVACSVALAGWKTRAASIVAAIAGLYVLGLPQLYGVVIHDHHILWFQALLAASPSGDAFSLDAWLRARRGVRPAPAVAYAIPVRAAWLLIGLIYFFPGWWKWRASGLAWALSDNLAHQMHWKWLQYGGWRPIVRLDHAPLLCHAAALAVMCFEVAFVFLVAVRRARPFLALSAVLFHVATDLLMRIRFTSLFACYAVLLDWTPRAPREGAVPLNRRAWPAAMVAAILITGVAWAGFAGTTSGWPFACYPTFHRIAGAEMPGLVVEIDDARGGTRTLDDSPLVARIGSQRHWGLQWSLAMDPARERRRAALADYLRALGGARPDDLEARFFREWRSVDPDAPRSPPRRELLERLPLGGREPQHQR